MLQHQLDLASPDVQLSVVDSLLITYYPGLALAGVYDPSNGGRKPLAAPTPVAFPSKACPEQVWVLASLLYGVSHVAVSAISPLAICPQHICFCKMCQTGALGFKSYLPLECSATASFIAQSLKLSLLSAQVSWPSSYGEPFVSNNVIACLNRIRTTSDCSHLKGLINTLQQVNDSLKDSKDAEKILVRPWQPPRWS